MGNGYVVQSGGQLPSLVGECHLLNISVWHASWSYHHQTVCMWIDFLDVDYQE